jgi:hypothetical protein
MLKRQGLCHIMLAVLDVKGNQGLDVVQSQNIPCFSTGRHEGMNTSRD